MTNARQLQFYKAELQKALDDLGVQSFDFLDVAGLQDDIALLSASFASRENVAWYDKSRTISSKWQLPVQCIGGGTAGLGLSLTAAGCQFLIGQEAPQPTLLWITVALTTEHATNRRHFIRWAVKDRDASVWAPWIEDWAGEKGSLTVSANTVPLTLAQLKRKVDHISELTAKLELAKLERCVQRSVATPSTVLAAMEALLEDMRKLAQRIVETNAKLERLCVATSLNSAAIQLIERLGRLELGAQRLVKSQQLMASHTELLQAYCAQRSASPQPSAR